MLLFHDCEHSTTGPTRVGVTACEESPPNTTTNDFSLRCHWCGRTVSLAVSPHGRFYDLWPARGWEFDGAAGEWRCAECAKSARIRREGRE